VAETFRWNRRERRVADGAAGTLRRVADFENFGETFGASGLEGGVGARVVKIVRGPKGEWLALFRRAAVATA